MIRKDKVFRKGQYKTHIRVVEGYTDSNGKIKQKTLKSFGYLEDQNDPVAFMKEVENYNKTFFEDKKAKKDDYHKSFIEGNNDIIYNYGYKFIESVYNTLNISSFFNDVSTRREFSLDNIFKFLVIERILNPDSKRATLQKINTLYGRPFDFQLHDVYRALDYYSDESINLQKHLNEQVKNIIGRNSEYAYYDVTNYYTSLDYSNPDDIRQKYVSKEHQLTPIVQLGLFLDSNGLPISMSLFKGNTADSKTLQPIMQEIKNEYNLNRLVVVADKGINSNDNINFIINNNDGYVVSQILKGKKGKRYFERLFDESKYTYNENKTFKYQLFQEEYEILTKDSKKETRKRNVLIYWKYEDALNTARKRDEKLNKAIKSLGNNAYAINHSYSEYVKEVHLVNETGQVCDKVNRFIDSEKAAEEAKYDGYFCIITSELDYDYKKILEVYGGLWRIEESFKITKSDLTARPIYLSTEKHINAHFLICYCALLIVRMLQYKTDYELSVERIVKALNSSNCIIEDNKDIKILKNNSYQAYEEDKTFLNDEMESLKDYLFILEKMNVEIPRLKYKEKDFIKYLNNLKY